MKYIILILSMFFLNSLKAQQEPLTTMYNFNPLQFNPAYAGHIGPNQGSATMQYRTQWLGIDGAPAGFIGAAEKSFFNHRLGLGVTASYEGIGATSNTEIAFNSAYRIKLKNNGYLSGGIRVGFGSIQTDIKKLIIKDEIEFVNGFRGIHMYNVGLGFLYKDETMELGISIPTLLSFENEDIQRKRHFYSHIAFIIGDEYAAFKWKPSLLIKYEKSVPFQTTIGTQVWIIESLAPGVYWRIGESLAFSLEFAINQFFTISGAYDFTFNELNNYSNGSFELMMSYKFGGDQ